MIDSDKSGWIDKLARMPADADGDASGCILAWHIHDGVHLTAVANFLRYGRFYTHWMKTPEGPIGGGMKDG